MYRDVLVVKLVTVHAVEQRILHRATEKLKLDERMNTEGKDGESAESKLDESEDNEKCTLCFIVLFFHAPCNSIFTSTAKFNIIDMVKSELQELN
jgi:hypothetical protein